MIKYKITAIDKEKNHVTFDIIHKGAVVQTETRGDLDLTNVDELKAQLSDYALVIEQGIKDAKVQSRKIDALIGEEKVARTLEERELDPTEEDVVEGA